MSASSPIAICNAALTLSGGNTILSFQDDTTEAKLCNIHYPRLRDVVTAAAQWTHATKRFGPLVPDVATPPYGYTYQYTLPSDLFEVIEATTNGRYEIEDYAIEDKKLLANVGSGIFIKYIGRVEDTTRFVMLFTEALTARLAAELSIPLAESRSLEAQHMNIYKAKMDEAMAQDGLQGRNKPTRVRNAARARFADGSTPGFYSWGP